MPANNKQIEDIDINNTKNTKEFKQKKYVKTRSCHNIKYHKRTVKRLSLLQNIRPDIHNIINDKKLI